MLVLFPAAAGAWVVAADFWSGAHWLGTGDGFGGFAHHVAGFFARGGRRWGRSAAGGGHCPSSKSFRRLMNRPLRHVANEIVKRHHARRTPENIAAYFRF